MGISQSIEALRGVPDGQLLVIACIGYLIGIVFYCAIKDHFAGKLLTQQIEVFGNLSRISHLVSYIFLGYVFPERFVMITILGVGWELIEMTLATIMSDSYWGEGSDYMYDIFTNSVGYILGYFLYKTSLTSPIHHTTNELNVSCRQITGVDGENP
jgi:hypothetical protein